MGKTALAMNIVEHVAVHEKRPVAVFSLEMSSQQLVQRMLCSRARVNIKRARDGFLAETDFDKLTTAAAKLAEAEIYIDDTAGLTILELRAKARRAVSPISWPRVSIRPRWCARPSSARTNAGRSICIFASVPNSAACAR